MNASTEVEHHEQTEKTCTMAVTRRVMTSGERGADLARLGEKERADTHAAPRSSGVLRSFYLVLIALVALSVAIRVRSARSSARAVSSARIAKLRRPLPRPALDASLHAVPRYHEVQPLAYDAVRAIARGGDATAAAFLARRVDSTAAAIKRLAAVVTRPIVAAQSRGGNAAVLPPQPAVHPLRVAEVPSRRGNEGRLAWRVSERLPPRALATLLRRSVRVDGFDIAIDAAHCRGTPYRVVTLGMETYCDCLSRCAADKRCSHFAAQLDGSFSCALYEHAAAGTASGGGECDRSDTVAALLAHSRSEDSGARMLYVAGRARAVDDAKVDQSGLDAAVPPGNAERAAETMVCSATAARSRAAADAASGAEEDTEEDSQVEEGGAESNVPEAIDEWALPGQQSWALFVTFNSNARMLEQTLGALKRASAILAQHIILIDNSSPSHVRLHREPPPRAGSASEDETSARGRQEAHALLHSELYSFFETFNVAKLDAVPGLMQKYRGAEAQRRLFRKLHTKYGATPEKEHEYPQHAQPVEAAPDEQRASSARAAARRSGKGATPPPLHSELARFYETYDPDMVNRVPELRLRVALRDELRKQYGVGLSDAPSAFSTLPARLEERGLASEVFRLKRHLPRSDVQVGVTQRLPQSDLEISLRCSAN